MTKDGKILQWLPEEVGEDAGSSWIVDNSLTELFRNSNLKLGYFNKEKDWVALKEWVH